MNMNSRRHIGCPRTTRSIVGVLSAALAAALTLGACGADTTEASSADLNFAASTNSDLATGESTAKEASTSGASISELPVVPGPAQAKVRREVIYTANVTVEVKKATSEANALRKLVIAQGGYVLADERSETSARMVLKIAPSRFDALLKGFEKLGKVRSQSVMASDVTADMVDLEARLKSAKVSRDRLEALLRSATKVEDVIQIESELQQREALVEQMQGQLNVLNNQVGFATVNVSLYEANSAAEVDDTKPSAGEGLRNGWVALRNTFNTLILALATMLPFLAVLLPCVLLLRWAFKRTAPRRAARSRNKAAQRPHFVIPGQGSGEATVSRTQDPDNLTASGS
jgi:hypothetical protein